MAPIVPEDYKTSYDVFRDYALLAGFDSEQLIQDLFTGTERYRQEGIGASEAFELLAVSPDAPQTYKNYLQDYSKIRQLNIGVTTVGEYNKAKKDYKALLRQVSPDLATDENANQFMLNEVSFKEASDRIETAFNAVVNADEALKQQLRAYYPSLKTADIVRTMLGVGKSVDELSRQIGVAGIRAEAATAGLQSTLGAEDLYSQGIDRGTARTGFQRVAEALPALSGAAARAGQTTEGLQQGLEEELVAGKTLASRRRKQLSVNEQASLSGRAGTTNVSLGRSGSGSF
jgi:hypothetical protein